MESQIKNFSSSASAIYMLKHRFITMRQKQALSPSHSFLTLRHVDGAW